MPGTREVLIRVLHDGSEHCCSWVRMLGLGRKGVDVEVLFACVLLRAHSPALGQLCALSVRWSRQYFLLNVLACASFGCLWNTLTPFATLTLERQEVQLPTEGHLAVGSDRFDVSDRHFGIARFRWFCHFRV